MGGLFLLLRFIIVFTLIAWISVQFSDELLLLITMQMRAGSSWHIAISGSWGYVRRDILHTFTQTLYPVPHVCDTSRRAVPDNAL